MKPNVLKRAAARDDLIGHFVYLVEHAGVEVADRFLANAETTFDELAVQPMMGTPLLTRRPELATLRKWRVREFENLLIFYEPTSGGVTVVRVLAAHQDWWGLFGVHEPSGTYRSDEI